MGSNDKFAMTLLGKKILVTGGEGFLGQHVIKELLARGVDRKDISVPSAASCDLRFYINCEKAVANHNVVFHLAAVTGGIEFHTTHPGNIFYDNLMMGVHLMESARLAGVEKFLTIGSATEYPTTASLPYREESLWQGLPDPVHIPYSMAKRMFIVQGAAYRAQYGFNAIHLMPNNMFGPGEKFESGFVIPSIMKKILDVKASGADFITSWGTGKAKREFVYVEDAARAIMLAAERYDKPEPVNIGSGEEISIKDLVTLIARFMDFKGEIKWDHTKPDGQLRRNLDVSRAEKEFGFHAEVSFEEGLKKTIDWHLKTVYK